MRHRNSLIVGVVSAASVMLPAHGQICQIDQSQRIDSPNAIPNKGYATALAISGNTVIVGDKEDDVLGTNVGAAHIYVFDGSQWTLAQTLRPTDGIPQARFGSSVAIEGQTIVIGAPGTGSVPPHGAAYVYQFSNGQWAHLTTLADNSVNDPPDVPNEQNIARLFGTAVAIDGNVIAIGAPNDSQEAYLAGAVYMYTFDGAWTLEQKLTQAEALQSDQLGFGVSVSGPHAIASAPGDGEGMLLTFLHDGNGWKHTQEFELPDGHWLFNDVTPIAVNGDEMVLGSPNAGFAESGRVYLSHHDGKAWGPLAEMLSPLGEAFEMFGASVAISGSRMAIGARLADVSYPLMSSQPVANNAGAAYLFELVNGEWAVRHKMIAEFQINPNLTDVNQLNSLGATIDIDGDKIAVGSPWIFNNDSVKVSAWYFYPVEQPDCDSNGVPDACDPDCNHNRIPDTCDLASSAAHDCDEEGSLDVCQAAPSYALAETGQPIAFGALEPIDFVWMNHFTVKPGQQTITHIALPWVYWMPDGHPATLMLYDDPNNDGDPHDAVLLTSASVTGFDDFGVSLPFNYTSYPITPTHVGDVDDSFFVAALVSCPMGVHPAAAYNQPLTGQSWNALFDFGKADITNLSTGNLSFQPNTKYMLRALTLDCNGNGTWDQCDIDSGFSADTNANGLPDECDGSCLADLAPARGNSVVDVDDLLIIINNWGVCEVGQSCDGDIAPSGGNDMVDVDDLIFLINNWGPCA